MDVNFHAGRVDAITMGRDLGECTWRHGCIVKARDQVDLAFIAQGLFGGELWGSGGTIRGEVMSSEDTVTFGQLRPVDNIRLRGVLRRCGSGSF